MSQVHAFLGPVCDYGVAPVARYSPYWRTPVLSAGAMAHDFGEKKREEYGLLTRVGVTFDSPGDCDSPRAECESHQAERDSPTVWCDSPRAEADSRDAESDSHGARIHLT